MREPVTSVCDYVTSNIISRANVHISDLRKIWFILQQPFPHCQASFFPSLFVRLSFFPVPHLVSFPSSRNLREIGTILQQPFPHYQAYFPLFSLADKFLFLSLCPFASFLCPSFFGSFFRNLPLLLGKFVGEYCLFLLPHTLVFTCANKARREFFLEVTLGKITWCQTGIRVFLRCCREL